ncbi:hypothetical protein OVY29_04875 [Sphingopyxis sp. SE2]|uniref:hypothetical protein n=1 Tax=Sphingopyxis sp. SE2 TaxID=1586240 RepID=UPI0028C192A0|nr:hypothetical protein [Sphingopyxis sp. SE2]MDT7527991.1 hypothetical protein [Sphingopyxis sp. SE2]
MNKPVTINELANAGPPPAAVMRMLASHSREQLEGFIEVALSLLDLADGDPDIEPNGDEEDGTGAEDEQGAHTCDASGPGCAVSDPDSAVDDLGCDPDEGH